MKSCSRVAVIVFIPSILSKVLIKFLNALKIKRLYNISSNIETLMTDNLYDYKESMGYIYINNPMKFNNWDCKKEYEL